MLAAIVINDCEEKGHDLTVGLTVTESSADVHSTLTQLCIRL